MPYLTNLSELNVPPKKSKKLIVSIIFAWGLSQYQNAEAGSESYWVTKIGPIVLANAVKVKMDASISDLDPVMWQVPDIVSEVYTELGVREKLVITSGSEFSGRHWRKSWSLHLKGRAIDLRGKNLPIKKLKLIKEMLEKRLGSDFDVVLKNMGEFNPYTHIHVEYDPE